jgi:flagellar M-ring protein FliF
MAAEERIPGERLETDADPAIKKKNLPTLLKELPLSRKIAMAAVALICLGLFAVLIIQGRTADYQLLYANLEEGDASSVVTWLKTQRIPYDLKNGGKNIWVPADKLYETRLELAANGLPSGGGVGFEIFDKQSFALTDYVQKVNLTRALQGELARTITSLEPVESTRVHLALPEKRLFKNQQSNATASVIVTLVPGRTLDKKQVQGIIHLVAGSVPELNPENVKIIDANGVVLESNETADQDKLLSADMLTFQQEVEQRLEMRAQDLLDKTMGKDKAMVRVTATLDFSKVEKTQELFDGEDPVIRSEQVSQENNGGQTTGGIPGVQSNLQGNSGGQTTTTPGSSKNSRTTNYEISKTINKVVNPVGSITKLSVSVLVADKEETSTDGKQTKTAPRSAEELKSLENMVSTALGLLPARGDQISVLSMPFTERQDEKTLTESTPTSLLYDYLPLIKIVLVSVGAFLLYFLMIRPIIKTMKVEVSRHYKTVEELEREHAKEAAVEEEIQIPVDDAVAILRREIMRNHIPTAHIVKNWIQEG